MLAFAARTQAEPDRPPFEALTFLGLVGLEDPPRADVPDAIRACHQAGIRVVMITGDHAGTARSIARAVELGGARRAWSRAAILPTAGEATGDSCRRRSSRA